MNDHPIEIEFIVWADDGTPAYLPDAHSVVRWAQLLGTKAFVAWRVMHDGRRVEPQLFERHGDVWQVSREDAFTPIGVVAADPSDDPRVLAIVNFVHAHIAPIVEPIRVARHDWDPAASRRARLGYMPPEVAGLGAWVWRYCPELIAERTAQLTDEEFDYFLSVIDTSVALHQLHKDVPLPQREDIIDSQTMHSAAARQLMERL